MGHEKPTFRRADDSDFHGGSDYHIKRQQHDAIERGALRVVEVGAPTVEHHNGTVNATPAELTFARRSCRIYIYNADATYDLGVSFDGGTTYFTIAQGAARLALPVAVESVHLVGNAAGTDYQVLVVLDPIPQREPDPAS